MSQPALLAHSATPRDLSPSPILIGLLGTFQLLHAGNPIAIPCGGKTETLLCRLGMQPRQRLPRAVLVQTLWPASESIQAQQSLNSLVYHLHKLVGQALDGAPPVLHEDGYYRLNAEAGVRVDVARFDALASTGDCAAQAGHADNAADAYRACVQLYRGDLCVASDVESVLERERLRARFLTVLARLADFQYRAGDYDVCLGYAWQLLGHDPCREDAHRVVMRCHVQRGERAEALRHYHVCAAILRAEFDAAPEAPTTALYNQIRLQPGTV